MRRGKKLARNLARRVKDYEATIAKMGDRAKSYTKPGSRPGGYPNGKSV
jgi:hypothetical protein